MSPSYTQFAVLDSRFGQVAVIGNGSSGIQIVPQIQKKASRIVNYAREPTWISTSFGAEHTPEGTNFTYTEAQKQEFREKPETLHKLRKDIEHGMNAFFHAIIEGSPQQEGLEKHIKQNMETRLNNDPALITKIIPRYKAGCRRLTPGDG
jgi:cation diffusion facilitator CzcD-associated flavoprotein CzcO